MNDDILEKGFRYENIKTGIFDLPDSTESVVDEE